MDPTVTKKVVSVFVRFSCAASVVDESHVTLSQVSAMYGGDQAEKKIW
jgi:excinuclease UvrABC helicase subunit UvrB